HVGRQGLGVERVAAAAFGQRAAALEQELTDIVPAEALDDRQPLGHGEGLEPAYAHGPGRFIADIGHDMGGGEVVAVELFRIGYVELADEGGCAHGKGLQRVLHAHGEPGGDGFAVDRSWGVVHLWSLSSGAVRSKHAGWWRRATPTFRGRPPRAGDPPAGSRPSAWSSSSPHPPAA